MDDELSVKISDRLPEEREEIVLEMASRLHDHIEGQINRADNKAQLLLTANTLLAAALTFTGGGKVIDVMSGQAAVFDVLKTASSLLLFLALIVSVYYAVLASQPVMAITNQRKSLFFFGHISPLTEQQFIDAFQAQSPGEMQEGLLSQVYAKSVIATYKFRRVRTSTHALFIALGLWVVIQFVQAVV